MFNKDYAKLSNIKRLIKKAIGENTIYKIKNILAVIKGQDIFLKIDTNIESEEIGIGTLDRFSVYTKNFSSNAPVIYSAGIGDNIDFEIDIIKKYGAKVYAFDPTPKSISWLESQKLPENFNYFPYALTPLDGSYDFFLPENDGWVSGSLEDIIDDERHLNTEKPIKVTGKRLKTLMNELGHGHIDILKIDIEGSEFDVIEDVLSCNLSIGQLCIDTHQRNFPDGAKKIKRLVSLLRQNGYKIFYIRKNNGAQSYIKT